MFKDMRSRWRNGLARLQQCTCCLQGPGFKSLLRPVVFHMEKGFSTQQLNLNANMWSNKLSGTHKTSKVILCIISSWKKAIYTFRFWHKPVNYKLVFVLERRAAYGNWQDLTMCQFSPKSCQMSDTTVTPVSKHWSQKFLIVWSSKRSKTILYIASTSNRSRSSLHTFSV